MAVFPDLPGLDGEDGGWLGPSALLLWFVVSLRLRVLLRLLSANRGRLSSAGPAQLVIEHLQGQVEDLLQVPLQCQQLLEIIRALQTIYSDVSGSLTSLSGSVVRAASTCCNCSLYVFSSASLMVASASEN